MFRYSRVNCGGTTIVKKFEEIASDKYLELRRKNKNKKKEISDKSLKLSICAYASMYVGMCLYHTHTTHPHSLSVGHLNVWQRFSLQFTFLSSIFKLLFWQNEK